MVNIANWQWPQIVYVAMFFMSIGVSITKHGQPRSNHNFIVDMISAALALFILCHGGFFK